MSNQNNEEDTNVLPKTLNELLGSKQKIIGLSTDDDSEREMEISWDETPPGGQFQVVESRKNNKKKKRNRDELDSSVEEDWGDALVQGDVIINETRNIEDKIRRICVGDPAKKVTQKITADIMAQVAEIAKKVESLVMRNAYLKGALDCRDKEIARMTKRLDSAKQLGESSKKEMYSTVIGQIPSVKSKIPPLSGISKKIPSLAQVAVISPPEGRKDIDAELLKSEVMQMIDPGKEKIQVKGVRKRGDGKVSIEAATELDLKKIMEHEKLKSEGFTVIRSGAMNPKVVVYDVPRIVEPSEMAAYIYNQNVRLLGVLEGKDKEFIEGFIPRFRIGKKEGPVTNWVIETSPIIRNILRSDDKNRLYVKWQSCKIEDYRGVSRCYNCQLYGHVAKFCIEKEKTCSYCSGKGHTIQDCQEKRNNKNPTCAACKKAKKKSDHSINDKSCPGYKMALARIIERTDYGNSGKI